MNNKQTPIFFPPKKKKQKKVSSSKNDSELVKKISSGLALGQCNSAFPNSNFCWHLKFKWKSKSSQILMLFVTEKDGVMLRRRKQMGII